MPHKTTVKTNGQTLTVNASVSHWTTEALALTASGTNDVESTTTTTITDDYDLWFANTATTATITVKQLDGTTIGTYANLQVNPGVGTRVLNPVPDVYQQAADDSLTGRMSLAPSGALAETYSRAVGSAVLTSVLTSGTLRMQAIQLPEGLTINSVSFMSGSTAANGPTNQIFGLYDSSRVLLGETANDTSTAWAAITVKTLSFASPVTTTYTGLHYLAILVTASSAVPDLIGTTGYVHANGIAPILSGTSDTGLTTALPDPAAAITKGSYNIWAYVS